MAIKPIQILINAKDNASSVFTSLQAKVAAVGAAIASYFGIQAFAGVVQGAADFQAAMSRVKAATGATGEEMQQLKQAAQDAGANTKFTSVEAADALTELGKAGLTSAEAIQALGPIMDAAAAEGNNLSQTSEVVTSAIMGMGLAFTESGRVADVLAQGASATKTSILGLGQALSYAAPVATSLGVSLESTVAILGQFAQGGIDASRAGTALNSILSQFSNPASKFRNELAAAGITTGNFEEALHQLAAAGPRGSKAITAVGQEAGPALRAMLNLGMGALDDLTAKLRNAEGSAAAAAKVMQDNLNGSLNGLSSAWQTVKDVLGTPVLPVIKEGVDQLAAALRGAVADGTVERFGESFATAFQNAMKWVREFVASVDFTAVLTKMQGWADQTAAAMSRLSEWATNTGNAVSLAYNVMTAGANGVLTAIYGIGSVFAEIASSVMTGVAKLREGMAAVTFGGLSDSFKLAAEDARNAAEGFGQAAQDMRDKAAQSLGDMADRAQGARSAFTGLVDGLQRTAPAAQSSAQALARVAEELSRAADANAAARQATEKKAQADENARAAAEQHRAALVQLRADYQQLVQAGDLDAAGAKLQEINRHLRETANAGNDAGKAAQDAAAQLEAAFDRLGITSSAALKQQAEAAKRDYEIIKDSGVATAEDISAAFKKAADAAIAANKGIAPSWVQAQAGVRGYTSETDSAGKSVLKLRDEIDRTASSSSRASGQMQGHWGGVRDSVNAASQAVQDYNRRMQERYGRPGEGGPRTTSSRGEKLGDGVEQIGSGGTQFRNRDGMTSDARGNVQQQWVWTRSAIIQYLEEAGLDKLLAEDLAKQFVQPDGTVPYIASAAQKQWGGKYSTLAEALGKMADYYQYGGGKAQAAERTAFLQSQQGGAPAPTPAPSPAPAPSMFGRQTVTVNLQINGQDYGDVETDSDGARVIQGLLGELERSKRNTGR
ncbi:phage tail tape measure protein [Diaphorobacter sp.]|uniref:phage tail tape measure protein n=1 Tax=Diaphorobacter sp. TaxID=1934310 RepID=UPI002585034A|nr:phage tail tape measure protein [Diaphorobacter sp.]